MQIPTEFLPSLAQGAAPKGGNAGAATVMLGAAVAGGLVLLFIVARMGRRWVMHDTTVKRPSPDPRSRVDPWFEAGRRLDASNDDPDRPS